MTNLIDEDSYLIRASILWRFGKLVTDAYVKTVFFTVRYRFKYQEEAYGFLIEQVDRTVDLVYTKNMKFLISYEGIQRVE